MACPIVNYGIPSGGAKELSFNTGRELFRCGRGCATMFITNVTLDFGLKTIACGTITDALIGSDVCMQSGQVNWKDQSVVNWQGKDGVNSGMASGTVITVAADCAGEGASIYTHTEGQASGKCQANIDVLNSNYQNVIDLILAKCQLVGNGATGDLDWIFSDISSQTSATDWQSGSITFMGFGTAGVGDTSYNFSFNWQNGRSEVTNGQLYYDMDPVPKPLGDIVQTLLVTAGF
jgi:hypothetical protein